MANCICQAVKVGLPVVCFIIGIYCGLSIQSDNIRGDERNPQEPTNSDSVHQNKVNSFIASVPKSTELPQKKQHDPPNGRCNQCFKWKHPFTITPSTLFCSQDAHPSTPLDLIVLATSKHDNIRNRDIIRKTWGSYAKSTGRIRVIFAFGRDPDRNQQKEYKLQLESARQGDILQVDMHGTYRNMTRIVFNSFRWIQEQCTQAGFVVKISDDVYLNIPGLLKVLNAAGKNQLTDVVFGQCYYHGANPQRKPGTKWYETRTSYPYDKYPSYCSGAGMFLSTNLMNKLLPELSNVRFPIPHDDIMLGILLRLSNYCQCDIPGFSFFDYNAVGLSKLVPTITPNDCSRFAKTKTLLGLHLHGVDPQIIERFWNHQACFVDRIPDVNTIRCPRRFQCPENFYNLR